MTMRVDYALERQLQHVQENSGDEAVKTAISDALEYMASGKGRTRRGGKPLVALLAGTRQRAAEVGEWHVVRLLQDSLDYVEGRILKPEFEETYRLFQDGARSDSNRDHVSHILWTSYRYVTETARGFLQERPDASAGELIDHVDRLAADTLFLDAPEDRPGRYRILRGRAEWAVWLERVLRDRIDVEDAEAVARQIVMSPEALAVLADQDGQLLLRAAELQRRAAGLAALRKVAEDATASEAQLQNALQGQYWIFGGQFVGELGHRRLVPGDEYDIPLIRGDGALHIVELKRAMSLGKRLVKTHRNAWVPTAAVHDAVGQAVNYLVGLDENRQQIRDEFGIETRRASAIVLIGHPAAQPEVSEEVINEALRTFNTHVSRVEVITYKELIDNAERALGQPHSGEGFP